MACEQPDRGCVLCPRLTEFRARNTSEFPGFYNGVVPSFGELSAELLVVGLAPGLKGANATGRPFTGDYAGEVLYPALVKAGFACRKPEAGSQKPEKMPFADLELLNARITNAVRCVPPENKPTLAEINQCNRFLNAEIAAMPNLRVILTLGLVSHGAVLKALGLKAAAYKFGHGAVHCVQKPEEIRLQTSDFRLLNSYHTSRYNVNTGRLTEAMFQEVMERARSLL